MVVVVIISVLMGIVYFNVSDSTAQSRDAQRQADLRNLQAAIEAYKFDNGRYPERCAVTGESWSGQIGTDYECNNGTNEYIIGLAPKYIRSLPVDPKLNGDDSGYVYTVNTEGTVYKVIALNTVERDDLDYNHPLKSCDATNSSTGVCDNVYSNSNNKPSYCQSNNAQFKASYAVWGGYADPNDWTGSNSTPDDVRIERMTEDIICK